jgi:hypothetical protein
MRYNKQEWTTGPQFENVEAIFRIFSFIEVNPNESVPLLVSRSTFQHAILTKLNIVHCYYYYYYFNLFGALNSIVVWGTMLKGGRLLVQFPMRSLDFSIVG